MLTCSEKKESKFKKKRINFFDLQSLIFLFKKKSSNKTRQNLQPLVAGLQLRLQYFLHLQSFSSFPFFLYCNKKQQMSKRWDGAVVRTLACHQCRPGSIPGVDGICGLSLLFVLVLAPTIFLRVLRFSSHQKTNSN